MPGYLWVIDQGTTSTRAIIFAPDGEIIAQAHKNLAFECPHSGWVEQCPETIWQDTLSVLHESLKLSKLKIEDIAGLGISNQRETTIIWDKKTGEAIHPAIVWQDRRTADICQEWLHQGLEKKVIEKTGLLIDPYFSASKIRWILDHVPGSFQRAQAGELLFGTVETFLIWKLTHGKSHLTEPTNASRTLLYNIHTLTWDMELLNDFHIPRELLPELRYNADDFGKVDEKWLGHAVPIIAAAGDQQAATIGQACLKAGMMKATLGTGCFMLLNTGPFALQSHHRLLSTVLYRVKDEAPAYALEGSIFVAGATVQWLKDTMRLIKDTDNIEKMAIDANGTDGVYLVPAFTGLGAPYWDPDARGAILGLTRESGVEQIVRAALESVCYSMKDLWHAMQADGAGELTVLRVDGGMAVNDWLMQFTADMLNVEVQRAAQIQSTALGIAFLMHHYLTPEKSLHEIAAQWKCSKIFEPQLPEALRQQYYQGWLKAVARIKS